LVPGLSHTLACVMVKQACMERSIQIIRNH